MINNLLHLLVGYRRLTVAKAEKDAVLRGLLAAAVPFWKLKQDADGGVSFFLCDKYAKKLLTAELATEEAAYGIPAYFRRYRHRPGIAVAVLLFFGLLTFFSQIVWEIRITGLDTVSEQTVLAGLKKEGLQIGSFVGDLDLWHIQRLYQIHDTNFEWISANRRGTVVFVQVKEKTAEALPDDGNNGKISVLCADSEGKIVRVESRAGDSLVKPGDIVERGQPLVSGLVERKDGAYRLLRARGRVYAETVMRLRVDIPLTETKKEYTGEVISKKKLFFFTKTVKLFVNYGNLPPLCDRIRRKNSITLPGGALLPVYIEEQSYLPYRERQIVLTEAEAKTLAEAELRDKMALSLADAEIEGISYRTATENNVFTLHADIDCVRNIAEERFITFTPDDQSLVPPEEETVQNNG